MSPRPVHGRDITMSRINTNVSSLIAQRVLRKNNTALGLSLERLSTGLKINRGADNPAGLIASENLRAEKAGINQAISNAERASNVIGYAGGDLSATNDVTIELAGNKGTEQLSFAGGTTVAQIITAINALKNSTGVSAVNSAGDLTLYSTEYGSKQFVSLTTISGGFAPTSTIDHGVDASVTVNGGAAQGDGLNVNYRSADLGLQLTLKPAFNVVGSDDFYITGGGAVFAMGSKVTENDKASIGIQSVTTGSLGNATVGFLSTLGSGKTNSLSSGNLVTAQKILDKATEQVAQLRGRLGAFERFTIGSTINSLGVALENVTAADSAIRDTDFAEETANLTRSQILAQAATTVLAQANSSPQLALSLLRGQ